MQLTQPVDPFGEVNVHRQPNGQLTIVATMLTEPDIEGARTGLALDASASMKKLYGISNVAGGLFAKAANVVNVVEPVARTMAGYLANFSSNGKANLIYWACSPDGSMIQGIGDFNEEEASRVCINGPRGNVWGRGTKLLPPVRYFIENAFRTSPWAICVFLTDGIIEDLDAVKAYSMQFARQIATGQRRFIKLVLLGVGEEIDEKQMEELDDMFEGTNLRDPKGRPIDLWDHKLAREMRKFEEVFAEVVSEDTIVADWGRVLDPAGRPVQEYRDGLPALLRFTLPETARSFTLVFRGHQITQDISEAFIRLR
ncbi:MAG: hypothetical protein K2R98_04740 [Gemmataceae bacterium]|nr:hypothetical protein [Gemmataceae bacterium]